MEDCGYYLTKVYKNYMKLQSTEKRTNNNPYLIKFPGGEEIKFENKDN